MKTHLAIDYNPNLSFCNVGYLTGAPHLPAGRGAARAADGERPTCVNCGKEYDRTKKGVPACSN